MSATKSESYPPAPVTDEKAHVPATPAKPTPETPESLIKALIRALGHEPAEVASLDITPRYARALLVDRSMRSHKVAWKEVDNG